jgi:hypothetical protein
MRLTKQCWTVLLTLSLLVGVAALAQQTGLVNVDISNVRAEIAKNINVDVSQIPVNVQVPIDVAANVCGVDVNVLTSQVQQGNASCQATSTSSALNNVVQDQIKKTKQGP